MTERSLSRKESADFLRYLAKEFDRDGWLPSSYCDKLVEIAESLSSENVPSNPTECRFVPHVESAPSADVLIENAGGVAAWLIINGEKTYIAPGESYRMPGSMPSANAATKVENYSDNGTPASEALKAVAFNLRMTLYALLDRDITYDGRNAVLPFESHDQAINHIAEARRIAATDRSRNSA